MATKFEIYIGHDYAQQEAVLVVATEVGYTLVTA
jgi:hypothetical protein